MTNMKYSRLSGSKTAYTVDESPLRTALPVGTLQPPELPPINRPAHAGGTLHDPGCNIDLRNSLDLFVIKCKK